MGVNPSLHVLENFVPGVHSSNKTPPIFHTGGNVVENPTPRKGFCRAIPMIQSRDRISAPRGAVARLLRTTSSLHSFKCERGFCLNGSQGARENCARSVRVIHSSFTAFPQRQASLISERKSLTSGVSLFIRNSQIFLRMHCVCGEPNTRSTTQTVGDLTLLLC